MGGNMSYPLIKALHIIFMVTWFAGLFYIFRLFVYHVKHRDEANMAAAYTVMERKLLFMIMHPSMALTLLFGGWLMVLNPAIFQQRWLHWKLLLVGTLIVYQIFAGRVHKRLAKGSYPLSEKACRIINEVPALILFMIVLLAVLKP
jgi:protoporphyrinogen IX oxidase